MRRGLIVVALLVVLLFAGFVGATVHRNHQLGDRLVDDIAALRAKRVKVVRADGAPPPRHGNAFQCLAAVMKTAPTTSLGTFNDPQLDLGPYIRGERLTAELVRTTPSIDALRAWVEAMRGCSDASELQWVEGLEPWDSGPMPWMAVMKHTALDARILLDDQQPEHALAVCTEGLEFAVDLSHLGLLGAMLASAGLRQLSPVCSEAWAAASPTVHEDLGPRWVLLSQRLAGNEEILESERVTTELSLFRQFADAEARAKYPPTRDAFELAPVERLALMRLWSRWDAGMRALAAAKDPAALAAADAQLRETPWWLPTGGIFGGGYDGYSKFLARLDALRGLLDVLSSIATGAKTSLPPGATEKDGFVELPQDDGKIIRLRR
jgi:hypothetical protein